MIAIYARKSIDRPDSVSIDAQIDQCRNLAKGEVLVYADSGYSGKNIRRPEFERMIADIKEKKIETVISYRLDRVSRNIIDFANLLKLFEDLGVTYISATEQFDTSSPMGRAMIYIVMVFAQLERETIATRISDNYRFRAKHGLFMGGNTPFGYDSRRIVKDGKTISVLEPNLQANTLQSIFEQCSSLESLWSISHNLNAAGIRTTKGNLWTGNSVKRVLQNISPCCADERLFHYLVSCGFAISNPLADFDGAHGMCLFFKQKNRNKNTEIAEQVAVIGMHLPLISSEQFIRVQKILRENTPKRGKRSARTFLAGLVACKECGHSFGVKYTSKGEHQYSYFRCRGREGRGLCCNDRYLSAEELEDLILQQCKARFSEFVFYETYVAPQTRLPPSVEVEDIKGQIQNLINNIGKGTAMVDELLTEKIIDLQTKMQAMIAESQATELTIPQGDKTRWIANKLDTFDGLDLPQKSEIIRTMIHSIQIDKEGTVEITYLV